MKPNKDVKLNIISDSDDPRAAILSNLAETPFTIDQYTFPSVESALQGIKFSDPETQQAVFAMDSKSALKAGRKITLAIDESKPPFVYWQGKEIEYNSAEHRMLIAMFIKEKIRQNPQVQEALLATEGEFIYHDAGVEHPNTSLPEKLYIEILLAERQILKKLREISNGKDDKIYIVLTK